MAQRFIYGDHRNCIPEDQLKFIRWSRNLAFQIKNNAKRWELRQWKEYLLGHVQENATRYNMPSEWVENIRQRLFESEEPPSGNDGRQQVMIILYEFS